MNDASFHIRGQQLQCHEIGLLDPRNGAVFFEQAMVLDPQGDSFRSFRVLQIRR